jgi:hypothetical protein
MIHENLSGLLLPIDALHPLEGNPRRGNVDAIAASYREFGQVKPIVVKPNGDGTYTVIAGNHQLEAAKSLGWDSIAAVVLDVDDKAAIAFAIADNRTVELGYTDDSALFEMLNDVSDDYSYLLEQLQWDDFEMAALSEHAEKYDDDYVQGYVPPEIVRPIEAISATDPATGEKRLEAKPDADKTAAASLGSTAISASGSEKAIVQYTLVFDSADQQRRWYDFIRYLKSSAVYGGNTTAERLFEFIDAHSDF